MFSDSCAYLFFFFCVFSIFCDFVSFFFVFSEDFFVCLFSLCFHYFLCFM